MPHSRSLVRGLCFSHGVPITPAMAMRLPGIGSNYLWTMVDANKQPFDGAKIISPTTHAFSTALRQPMGELVRCSSISSGCLPTAPDDLRPARAHPGQLAPRPLRA